jgi:hypothetical protein
MIIDGCLRVRRAQVNHLASKSAFGYERTRMHIVTPLHALRSQLSDAVTFTDKLEVGTAAE